MLPANVFFPVVVAFLLLSILGWSRHPRHPLTWSTLPFVVFHNLLSHKEERFLFPVTILVLGVVSLSLSPVNVPVSVHDSRLDRLSKWAHSQATKWPGKLLTAWSFAFMLLLAFFPFGWNHDVRFTRALHERFGDEVHATAFPEIELDLPPFHPRVWDLDKADPEEVDRRVRAGTARDWLITSLPSIPPGIEARATLVYSELPGATDPERRASLMGLVDAYNARAKMPLRRLRYHTLYRISGRKPESR
jgi:phosphatidylinositol glycan class B